MANSVENLETNDMEDSSSLGAVSDSEPGEGGCPYAKRMRMDEENFADTVDTNFTPDPAYVAKLKEFQVLDEVEGDNDDDCKQIAYT